MSAILPTSSAQRAAPAPRHSADRRAPAAAAITRAPDRVELSGRARLMGLSDIRQDLVARVRAEIAAGGYETQERLEIAIAALAEELDAAA